LGHPLGGKAIRIMPVQTREHWWRVGLIPNQCYKLHFFTFSLAYLSCTDWNQWRESNSWYWSSNFKMYATPERKVYINHLVRQNVRQCLLNWLAHVFWIYSFTSEALKLQCVTIQMKAIENYFQVVLFIMLYKMVLTFKSVDETLVCDHSNESYWAVLLCGAVYYVEQGGCDFWFCGWNPSVWPLHSSESHWAVLSCGTIN